jgi:hypothetical protein
VAWPITLSLISLLLFARPLAELVQPIVIFTRDESCNFVFLRAMAVGFCLKS